MNRPKNGIIDRGKEAGLIRDYESQDTIEGWVKVAQEAQARITHGNI
jgi:hypothetical protein